MATRRLLTCFTQAQQKALREAKERILLTEDVLIQKDRTIKSLQNKLKTMEAARAGTNIGHLSGSHSFFFLNPWKISDCVVGWRSLQQIFCYWCFGYNSKYWRETGVSNSRGILQWTWATAIAGIKQQPDTAAQQHQCCSRYSWRGNGTANGAREIRAHPGGAAESMWRVCGKSSVPYLAASASPSTSANSPSSNGLQFRMPNILGRYCLDSIVRLFIFKWSLIVNVWSQTLNKYVFIL